MPVSTDDYVAVLDHIGRYCWRVDAGDADGWADLWTDDGVFTGISPEPIVGREALRHVPLGVVGEHGDGCCHKACDLFCDYAGSTDTIHAHFYNFVSVWETDKPARPYVMARCRMTLVRRGGGWLISRNDARMLVSGEGTGMLQPAE